MQKGANGEPIYVKITDESIELTPLYRAKNSVFRYVDWADPVLGEYNGWKLYRVDSSRMTSHWFI